MGIDLGTTNSAVAYVDTQERPWQVHTLAIPQLVAPGQVESRETLPSFLYQAAASEMPDEALRLPWQTDGNTDRAPVGVMAREEGTSKPQRLIASAKSWLCHTGVDRTADLLPWHGAADIERMSPVEASSRYLRHMHDAWNARFPDQPLAEQDVVLTLPASFDEVARELTIEAARRAGLNRVVLIEEPQAAFYAWVHKHADDWDLLVSPGQSILVCDIGGGTSDFTLIRVRRSDAAGENVQFHRVAVGEHLILGGDNLDLALARHLEQKLTGGGKLPPHQWDVLVRRCRRVKETLLGEQPPESLTVNLPSSGSRLIGGATQVEITRAEAEQLLLEGFLPLVNLDERPRARQSGFQEFGLPYAPDAAITRYLATFLTTHREVAGREERIDATADPARPDVVLFNGGFFASPELRTRLVEALSRWFSTPEHNWSPILLDNDRLDLAVARGAAYYGMVRRGEGVKIAASLARSYYIDVDTEPPAAVCIAPGSAEPGQEIELTDTPFTLAISQPVEFPLLVSSTRLSDRPGDLVPIDREQMTPLPPIRTVLKTGRKKQAETVDVRLHTRLTEIGTLDLWLSEVGGERSWRLQFDVRSATQTDVAAHESAAEQQGVLDETAWKAAFDQLTTVFGQSGAEKPDGLNRRLTDALESPRDEWPPSLLRRMWEALMELSDGRRKSAAHEARWLNLLGFSLRPGYGLAVDDWRVAETWRAVQGRLAFNTPACRNEALILWRRIAGGLSRGQQLAVAEPMLAAVRALHRRYATGKARAGDVSIDPSEAPEVWRLLGSLELLSVPVKLEIGRLIVDLLDKRKLDKVHSAMAWTLGRLGQRVPVYGPLNTVVPREQAAEWLEALLRRDLDNRTGYLAVMQLARRTDDRYRDLAHTLRDEAAGWLSQRSAPPHFIELVEHGGTLEAEEQAAVFGDSLPKGLRLVGG
ncbi:MAG: Hsp70 family protein [Planctomycetales bacterium]|nr:Hsp70 family protein [Planctomycetales bacterium]